MSLQLNIFAAGVPAVDQRATFTRHRLDEGSWVDVARHFLQGADRLFTELRDGVEWHQWRRHMYDSQDAEYTKIIGLAFCRKLVRVARVQTKMCWDST